MSGKRFETRSEAIARHEKTKNRRILFAAASAVGTVVYVAATKDPHPSILIGTGLTSYFGWKARKSSKRLFQHQNYDVHYRETHLKPGPSSL